MVLCFENINTAVFLYHTQGKRQVLMVVSGAFVAKQTIKILSCPGRARAKGVTKQALYAPFVNRYPSLLLSFYVAPQSTEPPIIPIDRSNSWLSSAGSSTLPSKTGATPRNTRDPHHAMQNQQSPQGTSSYSSSSSTTTRVASPLCNHSCLTN